MRGGGWTPPSPSPWSSLADHHGHLYTRLSWGVEGTGSPENSTIPTEQSRDQAEPALKTKGWQKGKKTQTAVLALDLHPGSEPHHSTSPLDSGLGHLVTSKDPQDQDPE